MYYVHFNHVLCSYNQWSFSTDKLRLKIPWSSLYSSPVVVEIDGLYVLAGPASGIITVYNMIVL